MKLHKYYECDAKYFYTAMAFSVLMLCNTSKIFICAMMLCVIVTALCIGHKIYRSVGVKDDVAN